MAYFKHPEHRGAGVVTFEDQTFPVKAGVVDCPHAIGAGADWRHATAEEIAAHEAADDAPVGDDAPDPDPADGDAKKAARKKR